MMQNLSIQRWRIYCSENYRDGTNVVKPCRICNSHSDCQVHSVCCQHTLISVKARGNYSGIFSNNISSNTATMLEEITEVRKNYQD